MTGVHQQKLQGGICRELPHLKDEDVRSLTQIMDGSLASHAERTEDLTQFALVFRHPGQPEKPLWQEAEKAPAFAREVYDPILARLSKEVQP